MAGPSDSAPPQRNVLGLIQQCLGLSASDQASESNSPVDVARVPPYPFEQDAIFLAIHTTVAEDENSVRYVEVGVATLDTARLADQRLPPGYHGGIWAEHIDFTTFIAHPSATSFAGDLEFGAQIPDWVLGCTRKDLALWLEKVWQRTDNPQISALPPNVKRNIVVITRSKEKLFEDLGHLGLDLQQHYAILDVFCIADIYRLYQNAQSPVDLYVPRSFNAIREDMCINEPIRQEPDKRSPSTRAAHAMIQVAVKCAVNNACQPAHRASGDIGTFLHPGIVTLSRKEMLARSLSTRTTYTLQEIQSQVAAEFPLTVNSPADIAQLPASSGQPVSLPSGMSDGLPFSSRATPHPAPISSSAQPAHVSASALSSERLTVVQARSGPAQHAESAAMPRLLRNGIPSSAAVPNRADFNTRVIPRASRFTADELPHGVRLHIGDYHETTEELCSVMARIARPFCRNDDVEKLFEVDDSTTTGEVLRLQPVLLRVAHVIRARVSQPFDPELWRALSSCHESRTKACDHYASRLTTAASRVQDCRQRDVICMLEEISQILFSRSPDQRAAAPSQIYSPGSQQAVESSYLVGSPSARTPASFLPSLRTPTNTSTESVSARQVSLQRANDISDDDSASIPRVLTPSSSIDSADMREISVIQEAPIAAAQLPVSRFESVIPEVQSSADSAHPSTSVIPLSSAPAVVARRDAQAPRMMIPSSNPVLGSLYVPTSSSNLPENVQYYQVATDQALKTLIILGKDGYPENRPHGHYEQVLRGGRASFDLYRCFARIVRKRFSFQLDVQADYENFMANLDTAIELRRKVFEYHRADQRPSEGHINFNTLLVELREILNDPSENTCCYDIRNINASQTRFQWQLGDILI